MGNGVAATVGGSGRAPGKGGRSSWGDCLVWFFIEDWAKLLVYDHLARNRLHHRRFFGRVNRLLPPRPAGDAPG